MNIIVQECFQQYFLNNFYFKAIFTLSQVTGILAPRQTAFLNKKTTTKKINKNSNILCYDSFVEASKNCDTTFLTTLNKNGSLYESQLLNNVNRSYVSNDTFFENRHGFPEWKLTNDKSPINSLTLDKNRKFHIPYVFYKSLSDGLRHKNHFSFDLQIRGFKTDRNVKVELERNPPLLSRIKTNLGMHGTDIDIVKSVDVKDANKMKQLLSTEDSTINDTEKQRLKIAFAEGYLLGNNSNNKTGKAARYFKIFQQVLTVAIFLGIVVSLMASANGSMFRYLNKNL